MLQLVLLSLYSWSLSYCLGAECTGQHTFAYSVKKLYTLLLTSESCEFFHKIYAMSV